MKLRFRISFPSYFHSQWSLFTSQHWLGYRDTFKPMVVPLFAGDKVGGWGHGLSIILLLASFSTTFEATRCGGILFFSSPHDFDTTITSYIPFFHGCLISELDMRAMFLWALMVVACMMIFSCTRAFAAWRGRVIALHCICVRLGAYVVIYLAVFTAKVFTRE